MLGGLGRARGLDFTLSGKIWTAMAQWECNEFCALTRLSYVENMLLEKLAETTVIGRKMEANPHLECVFGGILH